MHYQYPAVGSLRLHSEGWCRGCAVGAQRVVGEQKIGRKHSGVPGYTLALILHWAALDRGADGPWVGTPLLCPASALGTFHRTNNCPEIVSSFSFFLLIVIVRC